jgi:hypothetical protein
MFLRARCAGVLHADRLFVRRVALADRAEVLDVDPREGEFSDGNFGSRVIGDDCGDGVCLWHGDFPKVATLRSMD